MSLYFTYLMTTFAWIMHDPGWVNKHSNNLNFQCDRNNKYFFFKNLQCWVNSWHVLLCRYHGNQDCGSWNCGNQRGGKWILSCNEQRRKTLRNGTDNDGSALSFWTFVFFFNQNILPSNKLKLEFFFPMREFSDLIIMTYTKSFSFFFSYVTIDKLL